MLPASTATQVSMYTCICICICMYVFREKYVLSSLPYELHTYMYILKKEIFAMLPASTATQVCMYTCLCIYMYVNIQRKGRACKSPIWAAYIHSHIHQAWWCHSTSTCPICAECSHTHTHTYTHTDTKASHFREAWWYQSSSACPTRTECSQYAYIHTHAHTYTHTYIQIQRQVTFVKLDGVNPVQRAPPALTSEEAIAAQKNINQELSKKVCMCVCVCIDLSTCLEV